MNDMASSRKIRLELPGAAADFGAGAEDFGLVLSIAGPGDGFFLGSKP